VSKLKEILNGEFSNQVRDFRPLCERFDFNIMTLGCSNAYGKGLEREQVFDFILKKEIEKHYNITVSNWNLATPGNGSDHCKIIFNEEAPKLKPNLAIFWWPNFSRSFIFNKIENKFGGIKGKEDLVTKSYIKYISTDEQDIYNWYYNCYLFVKYLAKNLDIKLLHIAPDYPITDFLERNDLTWYDLCDDIIFNNEIAIQIDSVSQTDSHRGLKTHEAFGKGLYKILKEKGYFEKL
jgi:hypothetical protein